MALYSKAPFCPLCRDAGESETVFHSHHLKNPITGLAECPRLRSIVCPDCGATGDHAHTRKYCPKNLEKRRLRIPVNEPSKSVVSKNLFEDLVSASPQKRVGKTHRCDVSAQFLKNQTVCRYPNQLCDFVKKGQKCPHRICWFSHDIQRFVSPSPQPEVPENSGYILEVDAFEKEPASLGSKWLQIASKQPPAPILTDNLKDRRLQLPVEKIAVKPSDFQLLKKKKKKSKKYVAKVRADGLTLDQMDAIEMAGDEPVFKDDRKNRQLIFVSEPAVSA